MRTHTSLDVLALTLMVAGLGFFHIARPMAVSGQASASLTVTVTVVKADAAWSGHEMSTALAQAAVADTTASGADSSPDAPREGDVGATLETRLEHQGTVVWMEPVGAKEERTITVAHLGS